MPEDASKSVQKTSMYIQHRYHVGRWEHMCGVPTIEVQQHRIRVQGGNVYQWSDGYFSSSPASKSELQGPKLTLRGHLTESRKHALSALGKIFSRLMQNNKNAPAEATSCMCHLPHPQLHNQHIRFLDAFFKVPSLQDIKALSNFGWGTNEFRQIGLDGNMTLDTIILPTEVVSRIYPVLSVLDALVSPQALANLLTCGNGQWGQLVDSPYSIVQGNPVCAKNVSDLRGCNKDSRTMSPTGHVPLTLGSHEGPGGLGRGWSPGEQITTINWYYCLAESKVVFGTKLPIWKKSVKWDAFKNTVMISRLSQFIVNRTDHKFGSFALWETMTRYNTLVQSHLWAV
ncbi:hypothetical protein BDR07DRAFT_1374093 [Suillus spraguei]|nr:hypothetical protein BDR07DRAFT_1374093 [Suillus spraguei]